MILVNIPHIIGWTMLHYASSLTELYIAGKTECSISVHCNWHDLVHLSKKNYSDFTGAWRRLYGSSNYYICRWNLSAEYSWSFDIVCRCCCHDWNLIGIFTWQHHNMAIYSHSMLLCTDLHGYRNLLCAWNTFLVNLKKLLTFWHPKIILHQKFTGCLQRTVKRRLWRVWCGFAAGCHRQNMSKRNLMRLSSTVKNQIDVSRVIKLIQSAHTHRQRQKNWCANCIVNERWSHSLLWSWCSYLHNLADYLPCDHISCKYFKHTRCHSIRHGQHLWLE